MFIIIIVRHDARMCAHVLRHGPSSLLFVDVAAADFYNDDYAAAATDDDDDEDEEEEEEEEDTWRIHQAHQQGPRLAG